MIKQMERSHDNVLGYEVTGDKVTEKEYQQVIGQVRTAIDEHGKVRLLVRVPGFPKSELSALDDRLRFAREHLGDIERYAVVGDSKAMEVLTKMTDKVIRADLRHFAPEEEETAWSWVES